MKTIRMVENGWTGIPGDTELIVAFFKDGHKEPMDLFKLLSLKKKQRDSIIKLDCFAKSDMKP